jgi:hypothetical protein
MNSYEKSLTFGRVSFNLTDVKELLYKEIKTAHNSYSPFYISFRTEYSMYHETLDNYYQNVGRKNKPNKTDYLAYILLLTYSKEQIQNFQEISDMKLEFIKLTKCSSGTTREDINSDFEIVDANITTDEDLATNFTCICSKPIENIYKLKNKYTGIMFQVGCDCIKRHGLIGKEDLNKFNEILKIKKDRKKAIEKGLPSNYYEEIRKSNEDLKLKQKMEKTQAKQLKEQEKLNKKEQKQQQKEEKLMSSEDNYIKKLMNISHFKNCILCQKEGLYSKYNQLRICNKCVNNKDKNKIGLINKSVLNIGIKYNENECTNCIINFTYKYNGTEKYLCSICENAYKIQKCTLCPNEFMDNINSNDILCNDCDINAKNCTDCKDKFIFKNILDVRCSLCLFRFINKINVKKCQECDEVFECKENQSWKTYCSECYKINLFSSNCLDCGIIFKKLPNENWKKTCKNCYYK